MSVIKFCALGGLGETGKNMYIAEVDEKIFVLDCGLKFPSFDLYGIDVVIPDFSYLVENKDRIQGIFLSHGHADHIGALPELLKEINVGVFGSRFTMALAELALIDAGMPVEDYRLYRVTDDKVLIFGNVRVGFFALGHSIPETYGITIMTPDGGLVYAPDFSFIHNTDRRYQTSFRKIVETAKDGVLALFSESNGVSNINRVTNDYILIHQVGDILQSSKRVIFSMFSDDLQRIQKIINISVEKNRRVAIIGKKAQKTINIALKNDYLNIPPDRLVNLKYITDDNKNDDEDLVIIVTGNRHEPYYNLQRMSTGQDRLIEITSRDHVVIISEPRPGTERLAQKAIGLLYRLDAKVTVIPKEILQSSHANSEDLKLLYSLLKPKYIVPINGEYRHQRLQYDIALDAGYKKENVILLDNGNMVSFVNRELETKGEKIPVGDVLVDGSFVGDINEIVLRDRELLSQEGIILVIVVLDVRLKKIVSGPRVILKGFMTGTTAEKVEKKIENVARDIIDIYFLKKYIDWNDLKTSLRDAIGKEIFKMTKKNPIIIPSLVDVESDK
ncbi:MAG TPA: ribonuclease J [Bacilli bacterium]|jgi:ribonuclease J|nr:ribonuclease J [Acholeplasmataceae bacterium]HOA78280.1 ribonuclease J [Bacilli bacterium]HPZ26999.1 ribonuclease J [Bacilli bacterium]HQC89405.1 ribonuclease J [Bacilli bacterium]